MVRSIFVLLVLGFLFSGPVVAEDRLDDISKSLFKIQLQLAKKSGAPQDQFYLGDMYEKGTGTPRDLAQAHYWYKKSAAQNFKEAQRKLDYWEKTRAAEARAKQLEEQNQLRQEQEESARKAAAIAKAKQRQAAVQKNQAAAQKQKAASIKKKSKPKAKVDAKSDKVVKAAPAFKPTERALAVSNPSPKKAAKKPAGKKAEKSKKDKDKDKPKFASNPCEGPTAKFLSTCK